MYKKMDDTVCVFVSVNCFVFFSILINGFVHFGVYRTLEMEQVHKQEELLIGFVNLVICRV